MGDYTQRMLQYGEIIKIIESPREVTYKEMLSIIKTTKSAIELTEAAKMACQKNEQVRNYLGDKLNVKSNWKLRAVKDMLLNHPCIKQVNDRPILLLWFEDRSASSDRIRNDNYNETGSISQVARILSDVSEVCDDGNGKEIVPSKITCIQSDVSEVCDDGNDKTTSQQLQTNEEEEYTKINLSIDVSHQEVKNLDNNAKHRMDSTSHTSHTSPNPHSEKKELIPEVMQPNSNDNALVVGLQSDVGDVGDDMKTSRLVLRHSPAAHVITNDDFESIETERSSHSNSRGDSV